jgi:hypothetical protein
MIVGVNKEGRRIISYNISDGTETKVVPKELVIKAIENSQIANAKLQWYQGKPIVRINNTVNIEQQQVQPQQLQKIKPVQQEQKVEQTKAGAVSGMRAVEILRNSPKGTPLKVSITNSSWRTSIYLGIENAKFTFFDNSGTGIFQFSPEYLGKPDTKVKFDFGNLEHEKVEKIIKNIKDATQ